jgi:anti-sigma B factor antagonist
MGRISPDRPQWGLMGGAGAAGEVSVLVDAGVTVIRLSGEVDVALVESLDAISSTAVKSGTPILVDTTDVTFLDSIGAAFLARLNKAENERGRTVTIAGANQLTAQALQLSGLAWLVTFDPS